MCEQTSIYLTQIIVFFCNKFQLLFGSGTNQISLLILLLLLLLLLLLFFFLLFFARPFSKKLKALSFQIGSV